MQKKPKKPLTNKIKFVNAKEVRQRKDYLYIKNIVIPLIKLWSKKTLAVILWGLVYLMVIRLLGFKITIPNMLSSVALYFLIEEFKAYFIELAEAKK